MFLRFTLTQRLTLSKLILDHNVPRPFARLLRLHDVATAASLGWHELSNGELISAAEQAGFDVVVTADANLVYQQNLSSRRLGLVVINTNDWRVIRQHSAQVIRAVDAAVPGCFIEINLPRFNPFRQLPR